MQKQQPPPPKKRCPDRKCGNACWGGCLWDEGKHHLQTKEPTKLAERARRVLELREHRDIGVWVKYEVEPLLKDISNGDVK